MHQGRFTCEQELAAVCAQGTSPPSDCVSLLTIQLIFLTLFLTLLTRATTDLISTDWIILDSSRGFNMKCSIPGLFDGYEVSTAILWNALPNSYLRIGLYKDRGWRQAEYGRLLTLLLKL